MGIIETLKNSDLVWLILSLCTIIGVPLAIYFGRKSQMKKIINAVISSNELIINKQPNISKVKILYDNEVVETLTVTKLTFWSKTPPTINRADIIDDEPLAIFSKNGKILDVSVLNGDNTSNKVAVSLTNDTTANITFNYLDPKEGGIIQIIHTGDINSIDITRKIKGGEVKIMKYSHKYYMRWQYITILGLFSVMVFYDTLNNISPLVSLLLLMTSFIIIIIINYKDIYKDYVPQNCKKKYLRHRNKKDSYK